jgi:Tol biopolymer transport system component
MSSGPNKVAPMPTLSKLKLPLALLVVVALLALPAAAGATLTYTKGFQSQHVYYAENSGRGEHQIGLGRNSRISPDGETVIYEKETKSGAEMRLYSIALGKGQRLLNPWRESFVFAFSPDSSMIAALQGPLNGKATLRIINLENGKRIKVGSGYFNGVSFSPGSDEIVYGLAGTPDYPPKSDIYKYSIETGKATRLSHNGTSIYPLWGPTGQIVFARQLGAKSRKYGPANQLFVMNEEGQRISQVTHTEVNPFAQGLSPLAFSENGNRLLTEFGGQDESYAVAVNLVTGAEKALTNNPETGFTGAAISPDGTTVLGTAGLGFGGDPNPKVVTVPFTGGKQKVLVSDAYEPSWSN